jgi:hypothetical protein
MTEPKKETARIVSPQMPEASRGLEVGPLGPLRVFASPIAHPLPTHPAVARTPPIMAAPSNTTDAFESIPGWFCWGLLGISTLVFLIQMWNYALS